jgi:hypothetical protein
MLTPVTSAQVAKACVHGGGKAGDWSVCDVLTRAEESPASG